MPFSPLQRKPLRRFQKRLNGTQLSAGTYCKDATVASVDHADHAAHVTQSKAGPAGRKRS